MAILVLSLVFVGLYAGSLGARFHGLEYEDAFEYIYSGHLLAQDQHARQLQLNPICVEGSRSECMTLGTLAHPIGLATLISWLVRLFGPFDYYVSFVSLFCIWLCSVGTFGLLRLSSVPEQHACLGGVLFLVIPVSLSLGGTSLAEPAAAGLLTLAVLLAVLLVQSPSGGHAESIRWSTRCALTGALFTALVLGFFVKRESMSLAVTLPLGLFVSYQLSEKGDGAKRGRVLWVAGVCGCAFVVSLLVGGGALLDWDSIRPGNASSFSFANARRWTGAYLGHVTSVKFLFLPILAVGGLISAGIRSRAVIPLAVVLGYVAQFVGFGHSYYAEFLGEVPYFHFDRYTLQIAPLLSAMAAMGLSSVFGRRAWRMRLAVVVFVAGLGGGIGGAIGLRQRTALSEEELAFRQRPVELACNALDDQASVITSTPILFFMYCDRPVRVLSRAAIGGMVSTMHLSAVESAGDLYLWEDAQAADVEAVRYPGAQAFLDSRSREVIMDQAAGGQHSLYRLLVRPPD